MAKKRHVFRWIVTILLYVCTAILLYSIGDAINEIINLDNGWAGLAFVVYMLYAAPVLLFAVIYEIVILAKKKFWAFEFISVLLFVLTYASLYIVPQLLA